MHFRVLMVCSGNICRSPLAEGLLAKENFPKVVSVASAGIGALVGSAAHPEAIRVARAQGFDIQSHRARQFNQTLAQTHDLVLVMEHYQRQWIEQSFPYLCGRVHLLGKWQNREIADPFRRGPQAFDTAMADIVQALSTWRPRLS